MFSRFERFMSRLVIFNPKFWIMNNEYDEILDKWIRKKIENPETRMKYTYSRYIVDIDGTEFWVGNYPYAFGTIFIDDANYRPSRQTIYLLNRRICKELGDPNKIRRVDYQKVLGDIDD